MGLLDKLWDDTLAGPRPETGLGRLRKYSSFTFRPSSSSASSPTAASKDEAAAVVEGRGIAVAGGEEVAPRVTRSIMIKRPPGWASPGSGTPPTSPAGSTPPPSPFSPGGNREWNRFRRKSTSDARERSGEAVGVEAVSSSSYPPSHV